MTTNVDLETGTAVVKHHPGLTSATAIEAYINSIGKFTLVNFSGLLLLLYFYYI